MTTSTFKPCNSCSAFYKVYDGDYEECKFCRAGFRGLLQGADPADKAVIQAQTAAFNVLLTAIMGRNK